MQGQQAGAGAKPHKLSVVVINGVRLTDSQVLSLGVAVSMFWSDASYPSEPDLWPDEDARLAHARNARETLVLMDLLKERD